MFSTIILKCTSHGGSWLRYNHYRPPTYAGGYVFTRVCLLTRAVPHLHLHSIIELLPLVQCLFRGNGGIPPVLTCDQSLRYLTVGVTPQPGMGYHTGIGYASKGYAAGVTPLTVS